MKAQKQRELELCCRLFVELGLDASVLMTLEHYLQSKDDPATLQSPDTTFPDAVAILGGQSIGIELTAYSDDNELNMLPSVLRSIFDNVAESAREYPQLAGYVVEGYSLRAPIELRQAKRRQEFVKQLMSFVERSVDRDRFAIGERRRYPKAYAWKERSPFRGWGSLERQIEFLNLSFNGRAEPFTITPGNIGRHLGLSHDQLIHAIEKKSAILAECHFDSIHPHWLIIHADGFPASSRISLLTKESIDDLVNSSVREAAECSGFDRVYVWDGVRGGYVELRSSDSASCASVEAILS